MQKRARARSPGATAQSAAIGDQPRRDSSIDLVQQTAGNQAALRMLRSGDGSELRLEPEGKPKTSAGCKVDGKSVPCRIVVVYDKGSAHGTIYLISHVGKQDKILLEDSVVVGGEGKTPTGDFHGSYWEKDHVSSKYGWEADTPWSKSTLGVNAFGPYQLHMKETEKSGVWIHGTMGPGWAGSSEMNRIVSPTSHGCVRCANPTILKLHELMPNPSGVKIKITVNQKDVPSGASD